MVDQKPPVITIDGPSGTGKGTLATHLAAQLGFLYLDSGALYRALAWAITTQQVNINDAMALEHCIDQTNVRLEHRHVWCNGHDVTLAIRQESIGQLASIISANPLVRRKLLQLQRAQQRWPGLITDGRDMGTVVFPMAEVKIFLTASPTIRAQRRYNQLKDRGVDVSLRDVEAELISRDTRDQSRDVAPLVPADDAVTIDTSSQSVDETVTMVMQLIGSRLPSSGE